MITSDVGTVSVGAIPLTTTEIGQVLIDSAQYYSAASDLAWQYMQDLSLLAQHRAPRFLTGFEIAPEQAQALLSNALATVEGQLLATGREGARGLLASMTGFIESHGSMEGFEAAFFSAAMSLLNDPASAPLLDDAARAFMKAGGAEGVFGSLEHLGSGRFHANDLLPILDAVSGRVGLPAASDFVHAIEGAGDIFRNPAAYATHVGETLEAAVHAVKAPGHRLFTSVSHILGMISPSAGASFREFRHSDAGRFVETVGSIALGVGLVVGAPIAVAVKTGAHVVEGAVAFVKGIWEAVFGSHHDAAGGHPPSGPEPSPGHAAGHAPTEEEKKHLKEGKHAIVGCWVENPEPVPPSGPIPPKKDGSCPEPDFLTPVPIPPPGPEGMWPSKPQPKISGPGILVLVGFSQDAGVEFQFDPEAAFALEYVGPALGWNEAAVNELAATVAGLLPDLAARLDTMPERDGLKHVVIPSGDGSIRTTPSAVVPDVAGNDRIAVTVVGRETMTRIALTPMQRGGQVEVTPGFRSTQVTLGKVVLDSRRTVFVDLVPEPAGRLVDPESEFEHSKQATLAEYAYARAFRMFEEDPLMVGDGAGVLRLTRAPDTNALLGQLIVQVQNIGAERSPWFA